MRDDQRPVDVIVEAAFKHARRKFASGVAQPMRFGEHQMQLG